MVEGRSTQAFKYLLADRDEAWRDAVDVVAMDGFTGFKTATAEELSPTRQRSWIPFTSCAWPAMRWTGAPPGPVGDPRPPRA
jgi:transposase